MSKTETDVLTETQSEVPADVPADVTIDDATAKGRAEHDRLVRIEEQEAVVGACEREWMESQAETKAYKTAFDAAVDRLRGMIRDSEPLPLFDSDGMPPAPVEPSAWEAVRLDSIADPAIPPGALQKLADAGIETIGQVSKVDLTHKGSVAGIGSAAACKIADSIDAFWKRWGAENLAPAPEGAKPLAGGLDPVEGPEA